MIRTLQVLKNKIRIRQTGLRMLNNNIVNWWKKRFYFTCIGNRTKWDLIFGNNILWRCGGSVGGEQNWWEGGMGFESVISHRDGQDHCAILYSLSVETSLWDKKLNFFQTVFKLQITLYQLQFAVCILYSPSRLRCTDYSLLYVYYIMYSPSRVRWTNYSLLYVYCIVPPDYGVPTTVCCMYTI